MSRSLFVVVSLLHSAALLGDPVREQTFVDVNGTQLHLEVAGADHEAPLLLYLHGGPANIMGIVGFQANVGRQLEQEFLVAYLHQRGAGKSPAVPESEHTIAAYVSDVARVVQFLTDKYGKARVHIVGHSWGGALAALYAQEHRDDIGKLVLIAAPMSMQAVLRDSRAEAIQWAMENGRADAVEALERLDDSLDTLEEFGIVSRWANLAKGGVLRSFDVAEFMETNRIADSYPDWQARQASIARALLPGLLALDLQSAIATFEWPALFVAAEDDTIVPPQSIRRDFANYGGAKKLVVINGSHHLPFMDQPDRLAEQVIQFLEAP
jgi:pimeloyl-ACP methyl ester carboxylesterase